MYMYIFFLFHVFLLILETDVHNFCPPQVYFMFVFKLSSDIIPKALHQNLTKHLFQV